MFLLGWVNTDYVNFRLVSDISRSHGMQLDDRRPRHFFVRWNIYSVYFACESNAKIRRRINSTRTCLAHPNVVDVVFRVPAKRGAQFCDCNYHFPISTTIFICHFVYLVFSRCALPLNSKFSNVGKHGMQIFVIDANRRPHTIMDIKFQSFRTASPPHLKPYFKVIIRCHISLYAFSPATCDSKVDFNFLWIPRMLSMVSANVLNSTVVCAFSVSPNIRCLYAVARHSGNVWKQIAFAWSVCAETKLQCLYNIRDQNRNVQEMLMDECYVRASGCTTRPQWV